MTRKIGRFEILDNGQFRSPTDVTLSELLSLALQLGEELSLAIQAQPRDETGDYVLANADRDCRGNVHRSWKCFTLAAMSLAGTQQATSGNPGMSGLVEAQRRSTFLWPIKGGKWRETITSAELDRLGACLELIRRVEATLRDDEGLPAFAMPPVPPHLKATGPGDSLKPSIALAGASLEWLERECDFDRNTASAGDWRKAHETLKDDDPFYEVSGKNVPAFDTWKRYIREFRMHDEGPKHGPRGGRNGRSIVRPDGSRSDGRPS
jgi:hypothetical protein